MSYAEKVFGQDGYLSKKLEGYHPRPGQLSLAREVEAALEGGRHLLAEGPTGTGKSLAYGIPSAIWSMQNKQKTVIATANIALQEQLYGKDLPLIRDVLADNNVGNLRFSLMKGMGNYLCPVRLSMAYNERRESGKKVPEWLEEISEWATVTATGDKSEMKAAYPPEQWGEVCCSSEECAGEKCNQVCFKAKARSLVSKSDVIVTNYDYLFSDIRAYGNLLPEYSVLVMDEAHEAADKARGFMGFRMTLPQLLWLVGRLKKNQVMSAYTLHAEAVRKVRELFELFKGVERRYGKIVEEPIGDDCGVSDILSQAAMHFDQKAGELKGQLGSAGDGDATSRASLNIKRCESLCALCEARAEQIRSVCLAEHFSEGEVFYFDGYKDLMSLCCKVIEVQPFFREHLLDTKTVIATSATMSTNNSFDFIADQLGLENGEYASMIAPTPFDYGRVLMVLPESPFPQPSDRRWVGEVGKALESIISGLGGRTMALFTSYKNLRSAAQYLRSNVPGVNFLVQGEVPRMRIIRDFKKAQGEGVAILATASFWQGVDIPGKALSCVVIDKLPFLPPDDPVLHYIKERTSLSDFFDYNIPHATLSLKQGVGRLIRAESDYGAIVVCDVRIKEKNYGSQFLTAFPKDCFETSRFGDVGRFLKRFEGEMDDGVGGSP